MLSFGLFFICLVFAILFKYISNRYTKSQYEKKAQQLGCEKPPTLSRKGFLGLGRLAEVSKASKEGRAPLWYIEKFDEMGKDVHTFRASALDYELLVTRDPENCKAMFMTNCHDFEISHHRKDIWEPLLGNGIFTARGEEWKHSRQLLRPQFGREQICDLDMQEHHLQRLFDLNAFRTSKDGWTSKIDLGPLFLDFTMDVSTDFLYGSSVDTIHSTQLGKADENSKTGSDSGFAYHMEAGKSWLFTKALYGRWNRLIYSPKLARHTKEVHKFVDDLHTRPASKRFFLLDELAKYTQNPLELRNETLQILNAGRDTTGALLGWVFYFLARNERVFKKLRGAVLNEFGQDKASGISFHKIKNCEYLNLCIQEVLRVAGVVPVNERVCMRDTTLPRGGGPNGTEPIFLYKGLRVLLATYAMQHREDLWGADVSEFRPERWEEKKNGWDFIPFGAGPRKCIGQQFALTETAYVVVRFLQKYDRIENMDSEGPPFYLLLLSNRSGTGVQVRLHEAGQE